MTFAEAVSVFRCIADAVRDAVGRALDVWKCKHHWHPADAMIRWKCCRCKHSVDGWPTDRGTCVRSH